MRKTREDLIPEHVKRNYTYEDDVQEVLAEGWPSHMVEEIVHGRKGQRTYYRRIMKNRQYYQNNRETLIARTEDRNKRRAKQLADSELVIQEKAKEKHRHAQARYRASRRASLAEKERERRRAVRQHQTAVVSET